MSLLQLKWLKILFLGFIFALGCFIYYISPENINNNTSAILNDESFAHANNNSSTNSEQAVRFPHLKKETNLNSLANVKRVFFTVFGPPFDSSNVNMLSIRQTVGNFHGLYNVTFDYDMIPTFIIVISDLKSLSVADLQEISAWYNVKLLDLSSALLPSFRLGRFPFHFNSKEQALELISHYLLQEHSAVFYVDPNCTFKSLALIDSIWEKSQRLKIYAAGPSLVGYLTISKTVFASSNDEHEGGGEQPALVYDAGDFFNEFSQMNSFCSIKIRNDFISNIKYSTIPFVRMESSNNITLLTKDNNNITKVAIGIPITGKGLQSVENSTLLSHMLPTFIQSLTADEKDPSNFKFTIYLGYDDGDKLFDNETMQQSTSLKLKAIVKDLPISFNWVAIPNFRWITLIWSVLFTTAELQGDDYYFQLNDDVNFESSGWLTSFVHKLKQNSNIGVIGPNDGLWSCNLLTQAFVHIKTHSSIFNGWFYPPEIKDWYSDNWITDVYKAFNLKYCDLNIKIKHLHQSDSRYNKCTAPPWTECVARDTKILMSFLNNKNKFYYLLSST